MKYTLQEIQIKTLEKLQENYDAVLSDWKSTHCLPLESTLQDIKTTQDMMQEVFNELIEENE